MIKASEKDEQESLSRDNLCAGEQPQRECWGREAEAACVDSVANSWITRFRQILVHF